MGRLTKLLKGKLELMRIAKLGSAGPSKAPSSPGKQATVLLCDAFSRRHFSARPEKASFPIFASEKLLESSGEPVQASREIHGSCHSKRDMPSVDADQSHRYLSTSECTAIHSVFLVGAGTQQQIHEPNQRPDGNHSTSRGKHGTVLLCDALSLRHFSAQPGKASFPIFASEKLLESSGNLCKLQGKFMAPATASATCPQWMQIDLTDTFPHRNAQPFILFFWLAQAHSNKSTNRSASCSSIRQACQQASQGRVRLINSRLELCACCFMHAEYWKCT
jgi:hypothetical protein